MLLTWRSSRTAQSACPSAAWQARASQAQVTGCLCCCCFAGGGWWVSSLLGCCRAVHACSGSRSSSLRSCHPLLGQLPADVSELLLHMAPCSRSSLLERWQHIFKSVCNISTDIFRCSRCDCYKRKQLRLCKQSCARASDDQARSMSQHATACLAVGRDAAGSGTVTSHMQMWQSCPREATR